MSKQFTNGFKSWVETHHEIVSMMTQHFDARHHEKVGGIGGEYEWAIDMTEKFESLYKDRQWDGDFMDTIEVFFNNELNKI